MRRPGFLQVLSPVTQAWRKWTPVRKLGITFHSRVWDATQNPHRREPIVLVAGLGVSSRYWLRLGSRLAERFRVIAPDLPGFGHTPATPQMKWQRGPTVREQADQLLAWLDASKIKRAVLCGHSTGCQVVIDLASRYPDRVERLILLGPTFPPGHRSLFDYVPRLLAGSWQESPSLTGLLIWEYLTAGVIRCIRQGLNEICDRPEDKLPAIETPTLVIRGCRDLMSPGWWSRQIVRALPHATLVEISRVGHAVQYSSPNATAETVTAFLDDGITVDAVSRARTATIDNPRRDPLGPPQPIAPTAHAILDYASAAAMLVVPRLMGWGPRTRRTLIGAAVASTVLNLFSDHRLAAKRQLPMLVHTNADINSGASLLLASLTILRREPKRARQFVAAMGLLQIGSAILTAKPTGPARRARIAHATPPRKQRALVPSPGTPGEG